MTRRGFLPGGYSVVGRYASFVQRLVSTQSASWPLLRLGGCKTTKVVPVDLRSTADIGQLRPPNVCHSPLPDDSRPLPHNQDPQWCHYIIEGMRIVEGVGWLMIRGRGLIRRSSLSFLTVWSKHQETLNLKH